MLPYPIAFPALLEVCVSLGQSEDVWVMNTKNNDNVQLVLRAGLQSTWGEDAQPHSLLPQGGKKELGQELGN